MPRYAAFLRGVMPTNCKMTALRAAFEAAGFTGVKTVLGSGNVVFDARGSESSLERRAEAAMQEELGQAFLTMVRPIAQLERLVTSDPYRRFKLTPAAKRIVTFLRTPPRKPLKLPIESDGAQLLAIQGTEIFGAYQRTPKGPVFMVLIEKTFGKEVTTRTWDTLLKVLRAAEHTT